MSRPSAHRALRAGAVALLAALAIPSAALGEAPKGPAWTRHTVDSSLDGADGVRLGDVNGDGLPDIATGWEEGGAVRAYLNPGDARVRDPWPSVQVGAAPSVEDAVFADVDGDGAVDVIGSTEGDERAMYIYWAPKDPGAYLDASAWTRERLPAPVQQWMYSVPAQIDGKNGTDIVVGGKNAGGEIGVLVAPPDARDLSAWRYVPLGRVGWTMTLAVRDMDGDGDPDVLLADRRVTQEPDAGDLRGLRWLENPGSLDKPWRNHFIGRRGVEVMFSGSSDFDGDGDTDYVVPNIVTGENGARDSGQLYWIENRGDGRYREHRVPWPDNVGRAKAAAFGDIDRDGRKDIVLTFEEADQGRHGVVWLRQQGPRRKPVWKVRTLSGVDGIKYDDATLVDIDHDGDLDVFSTEERLARPGQPTGLGLIWYENPTRRG